MFSNANFTKPSHYWGHLESTLISSYPHNPQAKVLLKVANKGLEMKNHTINPLKLKSSFAIQLNNVKEIVQILYDGFGDRMCPKYQNNPSNEGLIKYWINFTIAYREFNNDRYKNKKRLVDIYISPDITSAQLFAANVQIFLMITELEKENIALEPALVAERSKIMRELASKNALDAPAPRMLAELRNAEVLKQAQVQAGGPIRRSSGIIPPDLWVAQYNQLRRSSGEYKETSHYQTAIKDWEQEALESAQKKSIKVSIIFSIKNKVPGFSQLTSMEQKKIVDIVEVAIEEIPSYKHCSIVAERLGQVIARAVYDKWCRCRDKKGIYMVGNGYVARYLWGGENTLTLPLLRDTVRRAIDAY
ncbi:MAG: hypothetical protein K0S63_1059 [Gammaproteobacteria bacterium]|jgi:hypothetical protein|nr:hypothetical protein [Gammaproteobacteria bacterium]